MKKWSISFLIIAILGFVVGCGNKKEESAEKVEKVKIGVVGENNEVWDYVKEQLKEENIEIELVKFTDYTQPNAALAEGEIDLNSFQHQIFLDNYNKDHDTDLVSIADTQIASLGIYSNKIKDVKELKEGAKIAIPNDLTNGGRALLLLQTAGLIKLDKTAAQTPTVKDITENKLNLKIEELDAAQTARALPDVDASLINSGMAVDAGFVPTEDAIFLEPIDETSKPYINIIVANGKDKDKEVFKKIIKAYQSDGTAKLIEEISKGSSTPAWTQDK
ncbi:MetQ/NlpA family ABC transporter substrate-binding protein [Isobaculum melis]|uniref:Lipoprotein n=1 Tax=Isobaculum melis TaxID=142588 RepID=A0A1H9SWU0_9LACT|nr:MetQ/NlpA family ABC transporter substrate-binding protein [Isobaculum melis]SER89284.1 D-methionine transport system substrate-binding protein [Isobaculum melis]